jgi:signal transduction histidine kinase
MKRLIDRTRLKNLARSARPRWTVRLRLTLIYGGVFLVSGVGLLAITYVLVRHDIGNTFVNTKRGAATVLASPAKQGVSYGFVRVSKNSVGAFTKNGGTNVPKSKVVGGTQLIGGTNAVVHHASGQVTIQVPFPLGFGKAPTPQQAREQLTILLSEIHAEHHRELQQLLFDSGIALVIMALLSVVLGWLMAGRALRPLRVITSKAQDISATNLHERIALRGADDEMKRLGDTFDALLGRLERAFDAQRQFVANASHELRTPLARQRTLLEVASGDPEADVDSMRDASLKAISAGEEQEELIEALLTLASSERGLDDRSPVDLAEIAGRAVESKRPEAAFRGVTIDASLDVAPTSGNARLAERLAANLVENAVRHNEPGGFVDVRTLVEEGDAVLRVTNGGALVPEGEIGRLFEPFQRMASDRIVREGHGLGLSIVRAVGQAHGATVTATSRPSGGLEVRVAFPLDVAGLGTRTGDRRRHRDARDPDATSLTGETVDAGSPATGD